MVLMKIRNEQARQSSICVFLEGGLNPGKYRPISQRQIVKFRYP